MAGLIAWEYNSSKRCYVFKRTDGRMMRIQKIKRVLQLDEPLLREVLSQGVPIANECEESRKLIRALESRFPEVDDVVEEVCMSIKSWSLFEDHKFMCVTWDMGDEDLFTFDIALSSTDLQCLKQLTQMRPTNVDPASQPSKFELDLKERLNVLVAERENANDPIMEESVEPASVEEDSDCDEGYYFSEDMDDEDYFG